MKNINIVLQQYKKLITHKRNEYYNNKLSELEDTTYNLDTKKFWNWLRSMDDSIKYKDIPPIAEENWMNYFQCLHSNTLLTYDQQKVVYELRKRKDILMQSRPLDYFITEAEISKAARKLKNNKSAYSDKIRNEMIKASLPKLLPVYHKLFNTVFNLGTVPKNWCNGDRLITPIFKSGIRNDTSYYRGICVSSCLGKLFFSILNQRLLEQDFLIRTVPINY